MPTKTICCIQNLIILENFFCINRSFIITDRKTRIICNVIFISMMILIVGATAFDIYTSNMSTGVRVFQYLVGIEFTSLVMGARHGKFTFKVIERLDEKCDINDAYISQIKAMSSRAVFASIVSLLLDVIGMEMLLNNTSLVIYLCVVFSAHDVEMAFLAVIINVMNVRLSALGVASSNIGSRVYRHVLIATSHLSELFTFRILLMVGMTLITTVIYAFVLFLVDYKTMSSLWIYLIWRETRSLYSLWILSSAVSRTEVICSQLLLQLAGRLALDPSISKDRNLCQYKATRRWYATVLAQRPSYVSGSFLSISMSLPLQIVDLSINYMVIIVQIYIAYH